MPRSNKSNPALTGITLFLIFCGTVFLNSYAAQEPKAVGNSEAVPSQASQSNDAERTTYKVIPITMEMEAGAGQFREWPGGTRTVHAGIGWIHPFGRSEYVAGVGYPEAQKYPKPSYFNEEWMRIYKTNLFCIYMLKDGNIYAYDGVVGNLEPLEDDDGKMDYLVNVIVGGTGSYEGATGMLVGRTPGRGKSAEAGQGLGLPVSILKLMNGYIRIPEKK